MIIYTETDSGEKSVSVDPEEIINNLTDPSEFQEFCERLNRGMDREFTSIFIEEFIKEYKRSCTSREWIKIPLERSGYKLVKV